MYLLIENVFIVTFFIEMYLIPIQFGLILFYWHFTWNDNWIGYVFMERLKDHRIVHLSILTFSQ